MSTRIHVRRAAVGEESPDSRASDVQDASSVRSPRFVLANRNWYPGLCTTCIHDEACTFPRSLDRPVVSCDEFVGVSGPERRPSVKAGPPGKRFVAANREWFPGLCSTCVKRESCTFPKPEGGVFNCEEFE